MIQFFLYILLLLSFVSCKLKDQPKNTPNEEKLLYSIKNNYFANSVIRYYSETYLRNKNSGDYTLVIKFQDSIKMKIFENSLDSITKNIQKDIIRDDTLIKNIVIHLVYEPFGKSYEIRKYYEHQISKSHLTSEK